MNQLGSFRGGSLGAQMMIFLHELAHIIGGIPPDSPHVDPRREQEQRNQDKMSDKCDKAIEQAIKGINQEEGK